MNKIDNIGNIIDDVIKKMDIKRKLNISNIFNRWEEIVGAEIYKKTKPERIIRGILYISVSTSTWANELSLMSGQLIKKINSFVGEEVVKNIRFRQNL